MSWCSNPLKFKHVLETLQLSTESSDPDGAPPRPTPVRLALRAAGRRVVVVVVRRVVRRAIEHVVAEELLERHREAEDGGGSREPGQLVAAHVHRREDVHLGAARARRRHELDVLSALGDILRAEERVRQQCEKSCEIPDKGRSTSFHGLSRAGLQCAVPRTVCVSDQL